MFSGCYDYLNTLKYFCVFYNKFILKLSQDCRLPRGVSEVTEAVGFHGENYIYYDLQNLEILVLKCFQVFQFRLPISRIN